MSYYTVHYWTHGYLNTDALVDMNIEQSTVQKYAHIKLIITPLTYNNFHCTKISHDPQNCATVTMTLTVYLTIYPVI